MRATSLSGPKWNRRTFLWRTTTGIFGSLPFWNAAAVRGADAFESGRYVLKAARTIAGKRDLILTVTHAHPEHTFGAQAFKGTAKIYYNKLQRDYLARDGEKLVASFGGSKTDGAERLRQLESRVRDQHPTWERAEFVAPALRYLLEQAGA